MLRDGTVITTCNMCFAGCGILVHLRDGKATLIEGNPEAPLNRGEICPKATAALEHLYHPDRLKHPLRRTGQRGEGKWQQISWDEALGTVADEMNKARDSYGVESVVFLRGVANGARGKDKILWPNPFPQVEDVPQHLNAMANAQQFFLAEVPPRGRVDPLPYRRAACDD